MDPAQFLPQLAAQAPQPFHPLLAKLLELYQLKLWHELTKAVEEVFGMAGSGPLKMPILEHFIPKWEQQMRPRSLLSLTISAAAELGNPKASADLLAGLAERFQGRLKGASDGLKGQLGPLIQWARLEQGHWLLRCGLGADGVAQVRCIVAEAQTAIAQQAQPDAQLVASFYRVQTDLAKSVAAFSEHYRHGLLFLACCLDSTPPADAVERVHDLAMSAMLAPDHIHQFGDLLGHPLVNQHLSKDLYQLLLTMHEGRTDIQPMLTPLLPRYPLLQAHLPVIQEKASLIRLVSTIAAHPRDQPLSLATLGPNIEPLLIRAFSLQLIKGHIDGVDEVVHIHWVQPRHLTMTQLETLRSSLRSQCERVQQAEAMLTNLIPELTAA